MPQVSVSDRKAHITLNVKETALLREMLVNEVIGTPGGDFGLEPALNQGLEPDALYWESGSTMEQALAFAKVLLEMLPQ